MDSISEFNELFWSEKFWLPPNVTWADLERDEETFIPHVGDLWIPIPLAIFMFLLRLLWERVVALPIGRHYKIRESRPRKPVPNEILEKEYRKNKRIVPEGKHLASISNEVGWETRQVERWWRRRRVMGKTSEMQRFKESSWRFLFYLCSFWYGVYILWDKPWFWDTKHCWYGYPRQHVGFETQLFYMVELGFYLSLILSLFMDTKRKDFTEMMIHHFITIILMVFSWSNNMVRIGTLVLCVHDAVDYWLEAAKLAKYCKKHKLCDALFVIFTLVWFATRIVLYPLRLLWSCLFEAAGILGFVLSLYVIYNGLLIIVQILNIFWFYTICSMAYSFIVYGKVWYKLYEQELASIQHLNPHPFLHWELVLNGHFCPLLFVLFTRDQGDQIPSPYFS